MICDLCTINICSFVFLKSIRNKKIRPNRFQTNLVSNTKTNTHKSVLSNVKKKKIENGRVKSCNWNFYISYKKAIANAGLSTPHFCSFIFGGNWWIFCVPKGDKYFLTFYHKKVRLASFKKK